MVTWVDGELCPGTWEGDESDVRRVDPQTGEVLERLELPPGVGVSGLESDGGDRFFCGGRQERGGEGRPPAQARHSRSAHESRQIVTGDTLGSTKNPSAHLSVVPTVR